MSAANSAVDAAGRAGLAEATVALTSVQAGRDPSLPANHPMNALSDRRKFAILCTLSFVGLLTNFA